MYVLVALAVVGPCAAHAKSCSPKDAEAADALADGLDSWAKLGAAVKQYGHCDDGSIAEGNSEAVARLLIDQWKTLPQLSRLVRRDVALKRFVLRHIDATLDTDDLVKIRTSALTSCPDGAALLCTEVLAAATRASQ
ncbi:MAG: hypothetical protein H7176_12625 [Bdellovibrionales bacterium]|nr:hypothetical protein [Massilia sp.]